MSDIAIWPYRLIEESEDMTSSNLEYKIGYVIAQEHNSVKKRAQHRLATLGCTKLYVDIVVFDFMWDCFSGLQYICEYWTKPFYWYHYKHDKTGPYMSKCKRISTNSTWNTRRSSFEAIQQLSFNDDLGIVIMNMYALMKLYYGLNFR